MQVLQAFRWVLLLAHDRRSLLLGCLLEVVVHHRVGNRPGRYEPRKVKLIFNSFSHFMSDRPLFFQGRAGGFLMSWCHVVMRITRISG
jgi:hypothetical protein